MRDKVKPGLVAGFLDFLPSEMIIRQRVFKKIQDTFERFGFDPLDTPTMERLEVLTGNNPQFDMLLYRTGITRGGSEAQITCEACFTRFSGDLAACPQCGWSPKDDQETALRFDLTVPLARVVASYPNLPKPFKRYQVGKVFRGERPQAGRYREFTQFDADTVGTYSMLADTEIVNIMYEVLRSLGFERFQVRINNRKVLNGLAEYAGFADSVKDVLRILDKLEKVGAEEVAKALRETLSDDSVDKIMKFVAIKGSNDEILAQLFKLFAETEIGTTGAKELEEIVQNLRAIGVPEANWTIDLSVARGLDYYTGPVFETVLLDLPSIGSVFSGGRYDDLVNRFSDASVPATGASVGVDRLFAAMKKLGMVETTETVTEVMIIFFDASLKSTYLRLAQELRDSGIKASIYLEEGSPFKKQLAYAVKQQIPVVLIMGPEEAETQEVQIKDMRAGKQAKVKLTQCVAEVKNILAS